MALTDPDEYFPVDVFEPDELPFTDAELQAYFDEAAMVDDRGGVVFSQLADDALPGDEDTYRPARWRIGSDSEAAWALAKYAAAARELAAIRDRHAYMESRVVEWRRRNERTPLSALAHFGHALEEYAVAKRAEDPKHKTLDLPNGKVSTRLQGRAVSIDDDDEVLAWAEHAAPGAVRVRRDVPVSELREHVSIVEIPTTVVLSCGCIIPVDRGQLGPVESWLKHFVDVGTATSCTQHDADALIARWHDTTLVVVDEASFPVPGVRVDDERLTATVKPS